MTTSRPLYKILISSVFLAIGTMCFIAFDERVKKMDRNYQQLLTLSNKASRWESDIEQMRKDIKHIKITLADIRN